MMIEILKSFIIDIIVLHADALATRLLVRILPGYIQGALYHSTLLESSYTSLWLKQ